MISRRMFLAGIAALPACRTCANLKKPIATVPYRFIHQSDGEMRAFVVGSDAHHYVESLETDGGWQGRVRAYDRASGKPSTLTTENVDANRVLAVSPTAVWFQSDGKLARVARSGGPVTTYFRLPSEPFHIAADADGAYAFRAHIDGSFALSTNVDLVRVTDAGEETVLATGLFPDHASKIVTLKDDIAFWNAIGTTGCVIVSKSGGPLRASKRMYTHEIVQAGHTYERDYKDGVWELDPVTGARQKQLMPYTGETLLGVIPAGVVLGRSEMRSANFGSRSGHMLYAIELYDPSVEHSGPIFDLRGGSIIAFGEIPSGIAWATNGEIGELG